MFLRDFERKKDCGKATSGVKVNTGEFQTEND